MLNDARRLLEAHNVDRQKVAEILNAARALNEQARFEARAVWQATGHGPVLQDLARDLEETIAQAHRINEQLQQKALEIITAMGS